LKNNNVEFILSSELSPSTIFIESPTYLYSSADTGNTGDLTGSLGSNNPSTPYPSSSQSGNPGSNNNSMPEPVSDFDYHRRGVGAKLRDLFVNKPSRTTIKMTNPDYSDRINI
jgi:hypothetical protein